MQGFQSLNGVVVVSPTSNSATWNLQILSLEEMLATTHATAPLILQPRVAETLSMARARAEKQDTSAFPDFPQPTQPPSDSAAPDGLLINGSDNNAAASKYSHAPAFGNRRPGSKGLFTGSIGAVVSDSAFDARPYSLTGLDIPKASYSRVTFVATLRGPLKIPHFLPRGPNFFLAHQRTGDSNADTLSGLVPTERERAGDLSALPNGTVLFDPITGLPLSSPLTVSTQARALLQLYPLPNLAGSTNYN